MDPLHSGDPVEQKLGRQRPLGPEADADLGRASGGLSLHLRTGFVHRDGNRTKLESDAPQLVQPARKMIQWYVGSEMNEMHRMLPPVTQRHRCVMAPKTSPNAGNHVSNTALALTKFLFVILIF